jgi:hypothetical protein
MEWEDDRLPYCILQSLNSQHHGCRLRIAAVKRGEDKYLKMDELPATELSFVYELLLPLQNDYICRESLYRIGASHEDVRDDLDTVGNLAASLIHLTHRDIYNKQRCALRQTDPFEFEFVRRPMIGPQVRYATASIASLDFISHLWSEDRANIREPDIIMWSVLTHLPDLRTLKSKRVLHSSALNWLTSNDKLESLQSLDIVLHSGDMTQHPEALVDFLRSLLPLKYLALAGETHSTQCQKWMPYYATSLRRLQLTTMDYHDSTFNLVSLTAIMQPPLPLLEHLAITIKRPKGNSDEVSMYKILGAMPRLQSIALGLDTSTSSQHMKFWTQRIESASRRDLRLATKYASDALVNKAVDEKLAIAIFRTISAAKPDRSLPLERLEVRPDCSSGEVLSYPFADWSTLIESIERSWVVVRRYPGLGSDELSVSQIQCQAQPKKRSSIRMLEPYTELILRRIWPPRVNTKANWVQDWQKEWHSFPLEE